MSLHCTQNNAMHVSTYMTYDIFDYLSLYKRANAGAADPLFEAKRQRGKKGLPNRSFETPNRYMTGQLGRLEKVGQQHLFFKEFLLSSKTLLQAFFPKAALPVLASFRSLCSKGCRCLLLLFLPFFAEAVGFLLSCCLHSSQRSTKSAIAATKSRYTGSPLSLAHRCFSQ